jgi:hypothetical protein
MLNRSTVPDAPVTPNAKPDSCAEPGRRLPSGRSVVVKVAGDREELEIRDPDGQVELCVTLTADGPVVHVRGGRLELDAVETVAVHCRRFEVQTAESAELTSAGELQIKGRELRVKTQDDIHLNGKFIRLNC